MLKKISEVVAIILIIALAFPTVNALEKNAAVKFHDRNSLV